MKTWFTTALKVLGASLGILVAAYTIGFGGATTLYHLFKTERAEAEAMIDSKLDQRESKIMSIHKVEMDGIHSKFDLLLGQNDTIIKQNYELLKRVKK